MKEEITVGEASDPTTDASKQYKTKQDKQTWRVERWKEKRREEKGVGDGRQVVYNINMGILAPSMNAKRGLDGHCGIVTKRFCCDSDNSLGQGVKSEIIGEGEGWEEGEEGG